MPRGRPTDGTPAGLRLRRARTSVRALRIGRLALADVRSRQLLWSFETSGVRADESALSPDGRRLFVSALTSNEVQVMNTASRTFVGSFATGDWAHVLEFTPDQRYIVNGSLGNQLL